MMDAKELAYASLIGQLSGLARLANRCRDEGQGWAVPYIDYAMTPIRAALRARAARITARSQYVERDEKARAA